MYLLNLPKFLFILAATGGPSNNMDFQYFSFSFHNGQTTSNRKSMIYMYIIQWLVLQWALGLFSHFEIELKKELTENIHLEIS